MRPGRRERTLWMKNATLWFLPCVIRGSAGRNAEVDGQAMASGRLLTWRRSFSVCAAPAAMVLGRQSA